MPNALAQQGLENAKLLSLLLETKAKVEGRALRVRQCAAGMKSRTLEEMRGAYDDAKNSHNARLDAWILVLRTSPKARIDPIGEATGVAYARQKADQFSAFADRSLKQATCSNSVGWKEVGLAAFSILPAIPELAARIKGLFETTEEANRKAFVSGLERLKIADWGLIGLYTLLDQFETSGVGLMPVNPDQEKTARFAIVLVNRSAIPDRRDLVAIDSYPLPSHLQSHYLAMLIPYQGIERDLTK